MSDITNKINSIFSLLKEYKTENTTETSNNKTTTFIKGNSIAVLSIEYSNGGLINRPFPTSFTFQLNNESLTDESSIDEINDVFFN